MACSGPSKRTTRRTALARSSSKTEAAGVSNFLSNSSSAGGASLYETASTGASGRNRPWKRARLIRDSTTT